MKSFHIVLLLAAAAGPCLAANYYVSPNGLDTNNGTSTATPWLTLAHVNAHTFSPGDAIYLQRGGTWSEPLIPPSSGTSANPILFDAYGSGAAPVITGAAPTLTWSYNSGNIWKAQLPAVPASATVLNMEFGTLWGQYKAPSGSSCTAVGVIVSSRDFCSYGGYLYVYDSSSSNGPASFYGTTITPILTVAAGYQLISISNRTWLTFQHLKVQNFDQTGVQVWAASDNLVFANMEVDGGVPYGTTPLGIYINATSPASIKFYNVDGHLNYDAWKIAGTAASTSAIVLVNCSAFGNRDAAIVDNVAGGSTVVTYSHFYGNGLSTLWPQDVQGVAGPNVSSATNIGTPVNISLNFAGAIIPNYVDPKIVSAGPYAAWDTFTVDDVGMALPATGNDGIYYYNSETYVNRDVLPAFNEYGLKFSGAVTTGYSAAQGYSQAVDTLSVANWLNQGHGVNSHSWSHQYFTPAANLNAFTLLYNGTGTASISGNHLSTSVAGGTGSSIASLDLTVAPYNEVKSLVTYLNTLPGYTAVKSTVRDVAHTVGLADVVAQPISGTALQFAFDTQRMETDEMTTSMAWLNANIPGLTETYYVTPDGQESSATQGYAMTAGYTGERGELSMGGALGAAWGSNEVASKGVGLMNVVSFGMAAWNGNTAAQMDAGIDSLIFRQKIWGYPVGLFIHMPDLSGTQIFQVLSGLNNHGATVKLNTELRDWILGNWTVIPNTTPSGVYFQLPQPGGAFNAARTAMSPDVGAGQNVGAPYNYDINGVQRTWAWDIGAYQLQKAALGGGTGSSYFHVGGTRTISYSARTDVTAQAYPGTIPCPSSLGCAGGGALNGANYQMAPSDFPSTKLIRITDMATGGQSAVHGGYTTSCDASSEENRWNVNKDRFMICQVGNWQQLWAFNGATLAATRDTSFTSPGGGSTAWSYTQPYVYYHSHPCPASTTGCNQNDPSVFSYDATCSGGIATCTPPQTVVVDVATACSISALQSNSNAGGGIAPSADDQTFGGGFTSTTGQGSSGDVYVVAYTRSGNCWYWNTGTGSVYLNGVLQGTVSVPDRFYIHNVKMGKGGKWIKVSESTCVSNCTAGNTNLYWQIGTTNVTVATYANTCGHTAIGYSHWVNKCNGSTNVNGLFEATMATPNSQISLPGAYPSPAGTGDQAHINWAADNATDTNPFFISFEASLFPEVYGWDNELGGVATDGSGKVWRFAHTYVSMITPQAFIPIAGSQDGKYLLWTTDWDQMLGCTNGTSVGCSTSQADWAGSKSYGAGAIVTPVVGNVGANGFGYSYQTSSACTSGTTEPAPWNQTIGGTISDGGCSWTNLGQGRTDVFLAILPQ